MCFCLCWPKRMKVIIIAGYFNFKGLFFPGQKIKRLSCALVRQSLQASSRLKGVVSVCSCPFDGDMSV